MDMCKELGVTRQTISKDMKWIMKALKKDYSGLSTMFFSCMDGMNQVQRECWKIYRNEDNNPEIQQWQGAPLNCFSCHTILSNSPSHYS